MKSHVDMRCGKWKNKTKMYDSLKRIWFTTSWRERHIQGVSKRCIHITCNINLVCIHIFGTHCTLQESIRYGCCLEEAVGDPLYYTSFFFQSDRICCICLFFPCFLLHMRIGATVLLGVPRGNVLCAAVCCTALFLSFVLHVWHL
jgi:hypothetical protein